jgi:hypothetical protein
MKHVSAVLQLMSASILHATSAAIRSGSTRIASRTHVYPSYILSRFMVFFGFFRF